MTDGLECLGRARMQGLLLLLVVLLVGVLAGAAGDRLLSGGDGPRRFGPQRHGPPGPRRGLPDVLERMELSAAQRDVIDSLLQAYRPRSEKELREHHAAELGGLLERAGITGADPSEFRRYGSARNLYNFKLDHAGAY